MSRWVRFVIQAAWGGAIVLFLGTFVHESGHAILAVANGATIQEVNIVGLRIFPPLAFEPRAGYYGYVTWTGDLSPRADLWTAAAGSAATWLCSCIALIFLLRAKSIRRGGFRATAHLAFLAYCGDAVVHTLPVIGFPSYLFFGSREAGPRVSELYHAAVALGASPRAVLSLVFGYPLVVLGVILGKWAGGAKGRAETAKAGAGGRGRKTP